MWGRDTAWYAGNAAKNRCSIGIGHVNHKDGTISDKCLDNGAHLVAALEKTGHDYAAVQARVNELLK